MTSNPSLLRQIYDGVALFAVFNLLVLGGGMAVAVGTGVVDRQKFEEIACILRDAGSSRNDAAELEQPSGQEAEADGRIAGTDALAESQIGLEIMRRESDRIRTELDQRLALNNSILLRVITERESFRREQEEARREREASIEQQRQDRYMRQIAIYESLKPKTALQHLLAIPDPDEAAEILLAIKTRSARSIIEAAKRGEQLDKMRIILQRMREREPQRTDELASSAP
jgi:flagellar motility protein MotE (MotC chaperone)